MKRYLLILASALLVLTSCDGFLDKSPLDKLSPDTFFRTREDLELFSNTFYNNLLDKTTYKHQSDVFVQMELTDRLKGGSNRMVPASGGGWSWGDLRKINTMLAYIDNCNDEAAASEFTGVAKFFRAYFYYDKLIHFGDVPWYDFEIGSDDPALQNPRDSRELIINKMILDIDDAIDRLPAAATNPFRINRWTALALKAKFCLFEGTFRKYHAGDIFLEGLPADANDYKYYLDLSAKAADELITDGPYKLYSTGKPDLDYMMLFAQNDCTAHKEYILAINYDKSIPIYHSATAYARMTSQGRPGLTKKMVDSYLMKDGKRFTDIAGHETMQFKEEMQNRDPRLTQTIRGLNYKMIGCTDKDPVEVPNLGASCTGYQTIKYVQDKASGADLQTSVSFNDLPVIRLGEIYLVYAEAKAENGSLTQQDLDKSVNLLRRRVGMPDMNLAEANANPDPYLFDPNTGYSNVNGPDKGIILELRRERAVELMQEGELRYFDLLRWNEGKCIDQPMYGMYFPGPGVYDLNGDGKDDICLFIGENVSNVEGLEIGSTIFLSEGDKGYVDPHHAQPHVFTQNRDYLYPIPINERSLNKNLAQNPNWDDGLDF